VGRVTYSDESTCVGSRPTSHVPFTLKIMADVACKNLLIDRRSVSSVGRAQLTAVREVAVSNLNRTNTHGL